MVIRKMPNRYWPKNANPIKRPMATKHAIRAVFNRSSTDSRAVMAMKAGTAAIGSTMTNKVLKANRAYSGSLIARASLLRRRLITRGRLAATGRLEDQGEVSAQAER